MEPRKILNYVASLAVRGTLATLAALAFSATTASAETIDFKIEVTDQPFGGAGSARLVLRYRADDCRLRPPGDFEAFINDVRAWTYVSSDRTCADGVGTQIIYVAGLRLLDMGIHIVAATYSGGPGFGPAQAKASLRIVPAFVGGVAGGPGTVFVGFKDAGADCQPESGRFASPDVSPVPALPRPVRFPFGVIRFAMTCAPDCGGFAAGCLAPSPFPPTQFVQVEYPTVLPPGSSIWAMTSTNGVSTPTWIEVPAHIEGRKATFYLSGPKIDLWKNPATDLWYNPDAWPHEFAGSFGIAFPIENSAPTLAVQDLWWGGPGQDGWGVAIAQAGDQLFATLLVYDDQGQPAFYLLRDGYWDSTRTAFTGTLYRPNVRTMGGPVGRATLTFAGADHALLSYMLPSGEGAKALERLPFGPASGQQDPHAGIWDLTQEGTGAMTISKRGDALFIAWLEFPEGGAGRWLVAPEGKWTAPDTFEAILFHPSASRWAAGTYDASRFKTRALGSVRVRFTGSDDGEVEYTIDGVTRTSPMRRHEF